MAKPAEQLSNVHIIEELIQLLVGSDTVVIANSYIILTQTPEHRVRPRMFSKL